MSESALLAMGKAKFPGFMAMVGQPFNKLSMARPLVYVTVQYELSKVGIKLLNDPICSSMSGSSAASRSTGCQVLSSWGSLIKMGL